MIQWADPTGTSWSLTGATSQRTLDTLATSIQRHAESDWAQNGKEAILVFSTKMSSPMGIRYFSIIILPPDKTSHGMAAFHCGEVPSEMDAFARCQDIAETMLADEDYDHDYSCESTDDSHLWN